MRCDWGVESRSGGLGGQRAGASGKPCGNLRRAFRARLNPAGWLLLANKQKRPDPSKDHGR